MMDIRALGDIGIEVADLDAWRDQAALLGTMVVADDADGFAIKIDDRRWRIIVRRDEAGEGLAFAGWELADGAALAQASDERRDAGDEIEELDPEPRRVRELRRTQDPAGFAVELFWGPVHDHELFVSPYGVSSSPAISGWATSCSG